METGFAVAMGALEIIRYLGRNQDCAIENLRVPWLQGLSVLKSRIGDTKLVRIPPGFGCAADILNGVLNSDIPYGLI